MELLSFQDFYLIIRIVIIEYLINEKRKKIMKTNHLFFGFLASSFLLACGANNEYAYNEKTSSIFLRQMEQIDETHKSLLEDSSKIYKPEGTDTVFLNNKAKNTIANSQRAIEDLKLLKPSEEAAEFNNGVLQYFTAINQYGLNVRKMLDAKTVEEKKTLFFQLENRYKALNRMPDSLMEIQKTYFKKVGLAPKQE